MHAIIHQQKVAELPLALYLPDGSVYQAEHGGISNCSRAAERIIVTGAFPALGKESGLLVELIRDPHNASKLNFLVWKDGESKVVPHISVEGCIYLPPDPTSSSFPFMILPEKLSACGSPAQLLAENLFSHRKPYPSSPGSAAARRCVRDEELVCRLF